MVSAGGTASPSWETLQNRLTGRLVRRGQSGYRRSRELFNPRFDLIRPQAVAYCESAADVPKVTATMLSDAVLDVNRYPAITFESTSVMGKGSAAALDLSVSGKLSIHGKTQTVTAPVSVKVAGNQLTASGKFLIKQTDFGITPITIGGGAVKVVEILGVGNALADALAQRRG
jgi:hypothetical protein